MNEDERRKRMRDGVKDEWERAAMPHPRDILKQEHDRNAVRPRNVALEKWGPLIEEMIENDLRSERPNKSALRRIEEAWQEQNASVKNEPDMDRE